MRFLAALIFMAGNYCYAAQESLVPVAGRAIRGCLYEIARAGQEVRALESDTAVVYVNNKFSWINFDFGMDGSFGKRDFSHKTIYSCIYDNQKHRVISLSAPLRDSVIDEKQPEIPQGQEVIMQMLFTRGLDGFKFLKTQPYSPDNIEKNNPDFKWWHDGGVVE